MRIELLYPEYCNLFGDLSNMDYLAKCLPEAELIRTAMHQTPAFLADREIALVYMGPMTEKTQEMVLHELMPHRDMLAERIQEGRTFLFTGNALELLGSRIENEDGSHIPCLDIFSSHAKRDMMHRHNSTFMGQFADTKILGFKTQFTMSYPADNEDAFIKVERGTGMNRKCRFEGFHRNNCFATYLTGPLLISNPAFTRMLLQCMGVSDRPLAFEDAVFHAYETRLADFMRNT